MKHITLRSGLIILPQSASNQEFQCDLLPVKCEIQQYTSGLSTPDESLSNHGSFLTHVFSVDCVLLRQV